MARCVALARRALRRWPGPDGPGTGGDDPGAGTLADRVAKFLHDHSIPDQFAGFPVLPKPPSLPAAFCRVLFTLPLFRRRRGAGIARAWFRSPLLLRVSGFKAPRTTTGSTWACRRAPSPSRPRATSSPTSHEAGPEQQLDLLGRLRPQLPARFDRELRDEVHDRHRGIGLEQGMRGYANPLGLSRQTGTGVSRRPEAPGEDRSSPKKRPVSPLPSEALASPILC